MVRPPKFLRPTNSWAHRVRSRQHLFQFRPVFARTSSIGRAPAVDSDRRLTSGRQLQPGLSAAPETNYLPLLPSGPDGVRSVSPRRARLSTLTYREQSPRNLNLEREFDPAIADCGCRAPLAPRLARPRVMLSGRNRACQAAHKCIGNRSADRSTNCYVPVTAVNSPSPPHITSRPLCPQATSLCEGFEAPAVSSGGCSYEPLFRLARPSRPALDYAQRALL